MSEKTECPNCNASLKGLLNSNSLLTRNKVGFINSILKMNAESYCNKCGSDLLDKAKEAYDSEKNKNVRYLSSNIHAIPIVSTHTPFGWQYQTISIVTGQSVTGTGFISEFKSDFSDFFGGQSGSFNKKLSYGEQLCFSQLRAKALMLGANAVIATDIDYGEVGDAKGMLMVCAAGTAIKIINIEVLNDNAKIIEQLMKCQLRIAELESIKLE